MIAPFSIPSYIFPFTHPSTSGGGSGGGGGDSSQTEIPGYDPLLFIGFIGISSIIVIKKIIKKFK
ncbi:MAG: hypothetical protein ACTSPS_19605 [Promethearchaeota archaeon]